MPSKGTHTNVNSNIICNSCSWKPLKCPLTIEGKINCGLAPPWVLWSKENEGFIAACEWIYHHMLSNKSQAQKGASYSTPLIENLKNRYFVFYQKTTNLCWKNSGWWWWCGRMGREERDISPWECSPCLHSGSELCVVHSQPLHVYL